MKNLYFILFLFLFACNDPISNPGQFRETTPAVDFVPESVLIVGTVEAYDPEGGPLSSFKITDQEPGNIFDIDQYGTVYVLPENIITFSRRPYWLISVSVSDRQGNETTKQIQINVKRATERNQVEAV